jgi:dihydrofolate synthase/folylpolyglutamate synthase
MVPLLVPRTFQVVPGRPQVILDVAHNPAAAEVLASALRQRPPARRTLAVFGMLADKDAAAVVQALDDGVDEWLLVDTDGERGLRAGALAERMGAVRGVVSRYADVPAAVQGARQRASRGDRVLVLGSFHIVGPALDTLRL